VGALLSAASPEHLEALTHYGERLGLAFQIVDDILDEVGETQRMGKEAQRDAVAAKLTFPAVHGVTRSRTLATSLTDEAIAALEPLGAGGHLLADLAQWLLHREA
jgi:geranylgeranyl diphosphate synthase type II